MEFKIGILPHILKSKKLLYDIRVNDAGNQALFDINDLNTPISRIWEFIYDAGLSINRSCYYLVYHKRKEAIFHKDNPNTPVSEWWNSISVEGLLDGVSDYYICQRSLYQEAIFHKDNPNTPISKWYKSFSDIAVVKNTGTYYIGLTSDFKKERVEI